MWKLLPYFMLVAAICLAAITVREIMGGDYLWAGVGALGFLVLAVSFFAPIPTQAVDHADDNKLSGLVP